MKHWAKIGQCVIPWGISVQLLRPNVLEHALQKRL